MTNRIWTMYHHKRMMTPKPIFPTAIISIFTTGFRNEPIHRKKSLSVQMPLMIYQKTRHTHILQISARILTERYPPKAGIRGMMIFPLVLLIHPTAKMQVQTSSASINSEFIKGYRPPFPMTQSWQMTMNSKKPI